MKKEDNIWKDMNWGMIGVGIGSILVWISIFKFGFFSTLIWLIVLSAIVVLWIRLSGRG